jgi:2-C-methyl-D-erythritol 4-phosphate cytidylyltransferase
MGGIDKLFAPLRGKPALSHVLHAFDSCHSVDQIVVVASKANIERCLKLIDKEGLAKQFEVCVGGERRQDSVAAGLGKLKDCQWVVIHDGARPLVTKELIEQGLEAARETGAAIAAIPVTDTIKITGDDRIVLQTPPRQNLWAVQTPQVFRRDIIAQAYHRARGEVTDDASLVERLGYKVKLYMGAYDNIKITTSQDLLIAEIMLKYLK